MNFYYMNTEETPWNKMQDFVNEICHGAHERCKQMAKKN